MVILAALAWLPLAMALALPAVAREHAPAVVARDTAPAAAQRWKTDAPLRAGMARIRGKVDALGHLAHGHLDARQATQLADGIQRDVAGIVAHCTLQPDADAALHPILAALAQGAQAVKQRPADAHSIAEMRRALAGYARAFDDPAAASSPDHLEHAP